ncbi:MAG: hypothetical protein Q8P84_09410 [Deltaproteobacteria bacterium]|nr:hypothetical protein [Deltaproteobacteria bacterium]
MKYIFRLFFAVIVTCGMLIGADKASALDAGQRYKVTLSKVNSDGTVTDISTSAFITADSNGKLAFTFTDSVPTVADANWIVFTIKDAKGTVVRKGLGPAALSTETVECGVNGLSDVQAKAMIKCFADAGTDDPFYGMFGLMMLRSPTLTEADRNHICAGGHTVILGSGGVVDYLKIDLGVIPALYSTFGKKLVNNTASGSKDFSNYCAKFKGAVDNDNADLTAEAGGFLADVTIDAANAAGLDVGLITTAMETAGEKADSNADFNAVSSAANAMMDQAISNFFKRLRSFKVKVEYGNAFTALNSSGDAVTRFNSAVDTMLTCFTNLEAKYRESFENQTVDTTTQQAMNADFGACFTSFKTSIRSTDAEITAMKAACATPVGGALSADYGKNRDFGAAQVNQVIPATVLDNFVCTTITDGGSITYTRHDLEVPNFMKQWQAAKSDFQTDLGGLNASFIVINEIKEDIQVIQASMWELFSGGAQPNFAAMKAAKKLMQDRLDAAADRIGGTTNGATALTTAQKKGIIKMILEPDIN